MGGIEGALEPAHQYGAVMCLLLLNSVPPSNSLLRLHEVAGELLLHQFHHLPLWHHLLTRCTSVRLLLQHLDHPGAAPHRNILRDVQLNIVPTTRQRILKACCPEPGECALASSHLIKGATQCPDISRFAIRPALQELRGHICRRTNRVLCDGLTWLTRNVHNWVLGMCSAEISQLCLHTPCQ